MSFYNKRQIGIKNEYNNKKKEYLIVKGQKINPMITESKKMASNEIINHEHKIFDLSKSEYKRGELQKNLEQFKKDYVIDEKCKIKYGEKIIEMTFRLTRIVSGVEYYELFLDEEKRYDRTLPLLIDFIDPLTSELNNNTYIGCIHKTDKISGSEMVNLCLEINRKLGAVKTTLNDGAKIDCGNYKFDLSYVKLLERSATFYMKFGFEFEVNSEVFFYYKFKNKEQLLSEVNNLIEKIRKIKVSDVILDCNKLISILSNVSDVKKFDIIMSAGLPYKDNYYYKFNPSHHINNLINLYRSILHILNNKDINKDEFFYKILVKIFKDKKCDEYNMLINYIFDDIYKIINGDNEYTRHDCDLFNHLQIYRSWYYYSYYF